MATAVMPSMQGLSLDGGIMPPSPVGQGSSRHGRRPSVVKKGRGRSYSTVDEREVLVSKALNWVLKRTVEEGEEVEGEDKLVTNNGWVDCEDVLDHPQVSSLEVTLTELQKVVASPASKSRFIIKTIPKASSSSTTPSDFLLRLNPNSSTSPAAAASTNTKFTPLSTTTEDLPHLIVYETSYPNYPLVLSSGGIRRAGGQAHLQFGGIVVDEDGAETRTDKASDADVAIYIDLRVVMEADPSIKWARTETGSVVTAGDKEGVLARKYWKKAVARRADIGVLYENGAVKKEIPIGLRGKGAKGKGKLGGGKGKGREVRETKAGSEDDGSASD
ncbi:putative tRNA 2'-phosphotransferase 1 [Calycina marina]|uniref:tRNA 2'-phosphotransferase 1 n=1 Tax=Calycina marina TaxID=1763456 RepID=A0A9P8CBE8_9HELO|nr:putative tRNA 2'-phosphotransferase 1 [Calycina marina]